MADPNYPSPSPFQAFLDTLNDGCVDEAAIELNLALRPAERLARNDQIVAKLKRIWKASQGIRS
jgi:hypothetical protein